jgi:heme ABC exporter ATP-binding subunit CcmA
MDLERGDRPAVDMIGLTVFRRHLPVLYDINLVIQHGETLAIMGPNGAGKSTLLKCLGGFMRLNRGEIRWSGDSNARSPEVRRQIGYVGHECMSYGELTALENVTFAGRMHGVDRPRDHAMKLLNDSGLGCAAHRRAGDLSQGMRRRLAIARALVHNPVLILLDEPFSSIDTEGQRWLDGLFRQWRDKGRTVCFACHDVCQSRRLADRILWLDCGRVAAIEPSESDSATARRSA